MINPHYIIIALKINIQENYNIHFTLFKVLKLGLWNTSSDYLLIVTYIHTLHFVINRVSHSNKKSHQGINSLEHQHIIKSFQVNSMFVSIQMTCP